ncbi:hypothetical protein GX50_06509 [[Emmonsia] crescens]|uniref:Uncharacterized protein n=1 Tax=[Emmonsia] crescens TaxID=73230 RepID=A0A2B7Z4V1_9EURO|nr:hypothetical protein GX50_08870 [Emmonsia crescens]PGH28929.1 hypothetical protein GX50_08315 [Emmonsia crescens]PGH30696.1 hypothetical protein GX50_06509 [Emmonsia crescens]
MGRKGRTKQPLNRNEAATSLIFQGPQSLLSSAGSDRLLDFSDIFIQAGRRTFQEIPIHQELEKHSRRIPFLVESETLNINPLHIHLHRADTLRRYHGRPALVFSDAELPIKPTIENTTLERNRESDPVSRNFQPASVQAEIVVQRQYHHQFSYNINIEDSNKATAPELIHRDLEQAISNIQRSESSVMQLRPRPPHSASESSVIVSSRSRNKREFTSVNTSRLIRIGGISVAFTNDDLEWPTSALHYADDIPRLIRDWHHGSQVKLKGIPVSMKYWGQLYRGARAASWVTFKKKYSEFKSIMNIHSLYDNDEAFWKDFSTEKDGRMSLMSWTALLTKARKIRKDFDHADVEEAQQIYCDQNPGFDEVFSYRKGGKTYVMTDEIGISRAYRKLAGKKPRPWDYEDEEA